MILLAWHLLPSKVLYFLKESLLYVYVPHTIVLSCLGILSTIGVIRCLCPSFLKLRAGDIVAEVRVIQGCTILHENISTLIQIVIESELTATWVYLNIAMVLYRR